LYDGFFKEVMNPEYVPRRLNDFLSCMLGQKVRVIRTIPTDSTRLADESVLLAMDIVVELEDGSIANVEMQKDLDEAQNNLNRMNDKYDRSVRNGVELMRSLGMSDQEIVSRLCEQYQLTEVQAASFLAMRRSEPLVWRRKWNFSNPLQFILPTKAKEGIIFHRIQAGSKTEKTDLSANWRIAAGLHTFGRRWRIIMIQSRTHNCSQLRLSDAGTKVTIVGWYDNMRKVSKNLGFLILRDFYGVTQVVIETEEMMARLNGVNNESTLSVTGVVRERSSKNPQLPTGEVEVVPEDITVLGKCIYNELPFEVNRSREADEATRLKYRYLDLRNPEVKEKIVLRSKIVAEIRKSMTEHDFLEITTPILTCSSPEGARDYLVPARNHPGKFYALPQAPQQFKQLLMTSGFDRYFQIAPCFRDEDARADRSPGEFYQLDMEMAFATQDDVFAVIEDVLPPIFAKYGKYKTASRAPFSRISYKEAMDKYGSDKPDLRIDLTLQDATQCMDGCGFGPFEGQTVKAVVVDEFNATRKVIDKLCGDVEVQSGRKVYWFRLDEKGDFVGGISKFLQDRKASVINALGLKCGDFVGLAAGKLLEAQKTAGVLRRFLGEISEKHMKKERYEFCWIVDFPMYEIGEESGELEFCHNPFSMPQGGMEALETKDPLDIYAYQYDLVCNGVELSSGAVRNHDPEIMVKAFRMVGLDEEHVKAKFPAMYNAFCYGAPPHAGIAPGVDRMVMLIAGEESIREIIPFPMNKTAQDVMMGAPSEVEEKQLRDVHIKIDIQEKDL
jgi:aspartyl-tRNA synthetase